MEFLFFTYELYFQPNRFDGMNANSIFARQVCDADTEPQRFTARQKNIFSHSLIKIIISDEFIYFPLLSNVSGNYPVLQ